MSATDEELSYVENGGMDHVTYILIGFSVAFLLYSFIVFAINTYATTGLNAPSKTTKVIDDANIEMIVAPTGEREWYNRVPGNNGMQYYVVGDEEEEEDELAPL